MFYILDDECHPVPVTLEVWAQWFDTTRRIVARTQTELYVVSTVFLGANHRFVGDGPPLLFETMVFDRDSNEQAVEVDCFDRYASWDDALRGHMAIVRTVKSSEASARKTVEEQ